jgi:hypothetical protein
MGTASSTLRLVFCIALASIMTACPPTGGNGFRIENNSDFTVTGLWLRPSELDGDEGWGSNRLLGSIEPGNARTTWGIDDGLYDFFVEFSDNGEVVGELSNNPGSLGGLVLENETEFTLNLGF